MILLKTIESSGGDAGVGRYCGFKVRRAWLLNPCRALRRLANPCVRLGSFAPPAHFDAASSPSILRMAERASAENMMFVELDSLQSSGRAAEASSPRVPRDLAANTGAIIVESLRAPISAGTTRRGCLFARPSDWMASMRVRESLSEVCDNNVVTCRSSGQRA